MRAFSRSILKVLVFLTSVGVAQAVAPPDPRPAFLPSTPPGTKAVATYSAADVLGTVVTDSSQIPAGHAYREGKFDSGVKTKWPGAKIGTEIDVIVQIILDAPPATAERDLDSAWGNMRYILRVVFDVTAQAKADALVRIVGAQTDPLKKSRAATFAASLFEELLDPRLLAMEKDRLDDATVVDVLREEIGPVIKFTARGKARYRILDAIKEIGIVVDAAPFETADEAASCAALKDWLTAHSTLITTKCNEAKAKPDRELPSVIVRPWDARW